MQYTPLFDPVQLTKLFIFTMLSTATPMQILGTPSPFLMMLKLISLLTGSRGLFPRAIVLFPKYIVNYHYFSSSQLLNIYLILAYLYICKWDEKRAGPKIVKS